MKEWLCGFLLFVWVAWASLRKRESWKPHCSSTHLGHGMEPRSHEKLLGLLDIVGQNSGRDWGNDLARGCCVMILMQDSEYFSIQCDFHTLYFTFYLHLCTKSSNNVLSTFGITSWQHNSVSAVLSVKQWQFENRTLKKCRISGGFWTVRTVTRINQSAPQDLPHPSLSEDVRISS